MTDNTINTINDNNTITTNTTEDLVIKLTKEEQLTELTNKYNTIKEEGINLATKINTIRHRIDNITSGIGEVCSILTVILSPFVSLGILLSLVSLSILCLSRNVFLLELTIVKLVNLLTNNGPSRLAVIREDAGNVVRQMNELSEMPVSSGPSSEGVLDTESKEE